MIVSLVHKHRHKSSVLSAVGLEILEIGNCHQNRQKPIRGFERDRSASNNAIRLSGILDTEDRPFHLSIG